MKKFYRRSISGLLALLICFTTILSSGVTAFAASSSGETAKSYSVAFPRDGDANLDTSGTWGHDELHYMNGWTSGEKTWMTTLHTIGDFNGPACYCIEPGVPRLLERTYARYGEDYWKDYPSECNSTIDADTIKTLLGRIMQYGYQGNLSLGWRSQNDADADKLALMMATQVLVWETVVGERDANFNHVDPGGADAVKSVYRTSHPLYSRFSAYYDSIEASVKKHTIVPSFMARSTDKAQMVELSWDGSRYAITLTDTNGVLGDYTFSSEQTGITFVTSGNTLTITAETAPTETVTISATKNNTRKGVVVWSDGHYGPDGTMQDVVTYSATISDPVKAYLNLKVSYGSTKIVKTSEDGKVEGISFMITGNGVNKTVVTGAGGVIQIDNLAPGVYTVTEQSYDKYEPQEVRRVTVVSGQVATVNFNNTLKRGTLIVTKTSEDGLNEGVKFHLYGTSLSGLAVDEYAVTDSTGKAVFSDVLVGTGYTLEEVDTAIRYVVPEKQTAAVEWNTVTNNSFTNILKKWNVTVTKSDTETGLPQGDATLAGAVYGIYKGDQLVDTYTTDANGQFTTKYYVCGDDWTIREIMPSEGYLLDSTVYPIGAEAKNYTVEYLKYEASPDEQNFPMVMEMLRAADVREDCDEYTSPLDELFERLEMREPDHIAVKYYKDYHSGSAKTLKSIQITLAARLEKFNLSSLAALTATDELDLPSLGEKKVALFALIPDNDTSFNFLVSILYTQLFQQLFYLADHKYGGSLPVPVHFLMDEFSNVSLPEDFSKILAVMRSRNVYVSIILQNVAALKALFEKEWESILGNCDEFLYLGGNETSTHKLISESYLGKSTIDTNTYGKSSGRNGNYSTNYQISGRELLTPDEVRMLDNRYALLFIRGERPVMDEKYDILKHPNIALTEDGGAAPYEHGGTENAVATLSFAGAAAETLFELSEPIPDYELLSDEDIEALF